MTALQIVAAAFVVIVCSVLSGVAWLVAITAATAIIKDALADETPRNDPPEGRA